jgi:hypothetical protein
MSSADVVRSMKIKTNTLKRLQKEFSYYLGEKDKEQSRVDRLRSEGADPHDLKQAVRALLHSCQGGVLVSAGSSRPPRPAAQSLAPSRGDRPSHHLLPPAHAVSKENVLAESAMMIPETRARLEAALSDLQGFLVRAGRGTAMRRGRRQGTGTLRAHQHAQPAIAVSTRGHLSGSGNRSQAPSPLWPVQPLLPR